MNPRIFLVSILFSLVGVLAVSGEEDRKPNVILIFTDDQGTLDAGCYGAEDLETPALDAIAARGVRFTQFYAASAICSASRAGLLTGRTPVTAGVPGNVGLTAEGLPSSEVTIAEALQDAGYKTAHIGKWHLGNHEGTVPNGQGFDYSFGHHVGCIDNYSHFFYWNGPNKHDLFRNNEEVHYPGEFFPDMMVAESIAFMEKNKDDPFFIYFALNLPHYPYQGDRKWLKRYKDLPYPRNLYNAFMSTMDKRIEQLLDSLDQLGLTEDTIVIFQSDHGHSTEERAHFGGGYCGPYRGAKASLYEGGIRVPALISWPGNLPEGVVRDQLAVSCDWFPTILDLCGVDMPELDRPIDGKSLVRVMESEEAPTEHAYFHWYLNNQWVVREGNWKLCHNVRDTTDGRNRTVAKGTQLFDLGSDPGESTDIAADHPEVVTRMEALRTQWAATWED
ncbi:MAG: sulfatase-like hydrolase/transferase [Verrucomicrobiota bacterium]